VEYFCLVEIAGKKAAAANLDSRIRIVRDGQDVYTGPAKMLPIDGGGLAFNGKLKLSDRLTPGDYYLGIVAAGVAQWTDFEILP
jgi:hypothetical protein